MVQVFFPFRQTQKSQAREARLSALFAARESLPIGTLQAVVSRSASLGSLGSAGEVRSLSASSSALPVAVASSFARRLARLVFLARRSGNSGGRSLGAFGCEPPVECRPFSVLGFCKGVGRWLPSLFVQWLHFTPNKSINPTAGYGLSRSRISASAAAGYLQR